MFGAMIFNSLSLLSLLTVAITLTVLGFYAWAGVFYALSLLMLTKVGVDTTKDIRHELKMNKKMKKASKMMSSPPTTTMTPSPSTLSSSTTAMAAAEAAATASASASKPSSLFKKKKKMSMPSMSTTVELTDVVEEKGVCMHDCLVEEREGEKERERERDREKET